jgi:cell division protein FtsZ
MIHLARQEHEIRAAVIKVIGVGGGGGNTINSIIESGYEGIEFIAVNTDAQALNLSQAAIRLQIGVKSTKGLGTGANPDLGKRSAEEDLEKIMEAVGDADIVFLTGGLGGGTGSGGLPVIAHMLREKGILCIAVVTKPFTFEGKKRSKVAEQALEELKKEVDTLIVIPNQKLLSIVDQHVSMIDAFAMINDVLGQSVRGISDIITKPGHINVDFADVRTIMKDRGMAIMGTARASGKNRAEEAALNAISSPLLENMDVCNARGFLLNITGGASLGLHEISQAAAVIYDQTSEDANIIIGSVIDNNMTDEVSVTVIATGFIDPHVVEELAVTEKLQAQMFDNVEPKATAHVKASAQPFSSQAQSAQLPKDQYRYYTDQPIPVRAEQKPELKVETSLLDLSALDIPAFMRQQKQENKE